MAGGGDSRATKQRPYLLRAMHEWMVDNDLTPHIVVDATRDDLLVPSGHVKDGKLVLNVSLAATRGLDLGNEFVRFEARFGGVSQRVEIPVDAVLGIYARESGRGMLFPNEDEPPEPPNGEGSAPSGGEPKKPSLKVVK
jgi:stringent starvation protein B